MNLPEPRTICAECLKKAIQSEKVITAYCACNRAGAAMQVFAGIPTGIWIITSPATPEIAKFMANSLASNTK